jgi:hypothetical protein
MGAAADWSRISPFPRGPEQDAGTTGAFSVTNLSWSQQRATMTGAPLFGGRRQWRDYSFETTGYGSLELCGQLAYRMSIVHPADDDGLRRHHRLVRRGRLTPVGIRRRPGTDRVHVLGRDELVRSGADTRGSWLFTAQRVARLCGTDDELAGFAGPALRQLLWVARDDLGDRAVADAFVDLRRATEALDAELTRHRAAVASRVRGDLHGEPSIEAGLHEVRRDIEAIGFEARVLSAVRQEWDDRAGRAPRSS